MHRLIIFIFFVIITGSGLYFIAPVLVERSQHNAKLDEVNQAVLRNERTAANYDKIQHELLTNPAAAERVAREKLGFCAPGERVYIFEDELHRKSNKN